MKKAYLVGGLAIVGAIALVAYLRKPRKNSQGFYGADGKGSPFVTGNTICERKNADGSRSYYSQQGGITPCPYGGTVVTKTFTKTLKK